MQLDFEGLGFKLRIPIFNRVGTDLKLRTAVIPLSNEANSREIEFTAMQLTDSESVMITAFKEDISPSECVVDDTRKTINAVFHAVVDKGDTAYDLCIAIVDKTDNKRIKVHYTFNVGSTIAAFDGVEIEALDKVANEEALKSEPLSAHEINSSENEDNNSPFKFSYSDIGEPEENKTDGQCDNSSNSEVSKDEQERALEEALRLLEVARSEMEDATQSLLERDLKIAELQKKLSDNDGCSDSVKEELNSLKEENATLLLERTKLERDYRQLRQKNDSNIKTIDSLNKEIEKLKKSSPTPLVGSIEKHLNDIVDYMESTARAAGISLQNIHVQTSVKAGKRHVNVYGEIHLLPGRKSLNSSCTIKASLYDAYGNIEIEGSHYVSGNFKGFDTFNIGWNGGTDQNWLSETKIRIFVV